MTENSPGTYIEPTKIDSAASEACTRSGAFALLLSVLCFLLIPYWAGSQNEVALREYVNRRLNLASTVELIAEDALWQKYKMSHTQAESTPIAKLLDAQVNLASSDRETKPEPTIAKRFKNGAQKQSPPRVTKKERLPVATPGHPAPPIALQATFIWNERINHMQQLADYLSELNDSDLLSRSRGVSNFFDHSIVRWVNKRGNLIYGNAISGICTATTELEMPYQGKKSDYFVPKLYEETMLNCLTFQDVRNLAEFELPTLSNPTQLGGRIGTQIDLSPGALPRDPYMATIVVQILLFFALVHFGAYAREAVSSPAFPARATLFGAFSKPPLILFVFLLALWSPPLASLAMAAMSRRWVLWVCSTLIFSAVLSIHHVLQSKLYFATLTPHFFTKVNRSTEGPSSTGQ